jgi:hypothetical protein
MLCSARVFQTSTCSAIARASLLRCPDNRPTSVKGCSRRADRRPGASGLPQSADIFRYLLSRLKKTRARARVFAPEESRSARDRRTRPLVCRAGTDLRRVRPTNV